MKALPQAARWYLYGVWAGAALAFAFAFGGTSLPPPHPLFLIVGLVAFVLADFFIVEFNTGDGNEIGMIITDALVIFFVGTAGPFGMIPVVAGSLATDILSRRGWFKGLFNAAQRAINYSIVLGIFLAVSEPGAAPFAGPRGLATFLLMAAAYHTLNIVLVATVVALAGRKPLLGVYAASFKRVNWVHFITLPFGAILAYVWATNPWLILPAALPIVMAQRSFRAIADLQEQSRRNSELAQQATALLDELRTNQEALLRSSKLAALGTFAAGIGHEFNNLLTAILGNVQLGRMSDDLREKDEALAVVEQACLRGASIAGGLLAFARRREPQRKPCQLAALVAETVSLVQPELVMRGIVVEQHLEPSAPVTCDAGQIAQVLMNLLTNARDAMGGRGGRIVVDLRQGEGFVDLAVSDSGGGIPPEVLPQIFQPFVTTKDGSDGSATAGTGLGLAISHGIVESHDGAILVDSVVGVGTTMTIRLPVGEGVIGAAPPAVVPLRASAVG